MDDLISRTEIISTFTELGKTGRYGGMCEWVIEIVKQLPPAKLGTDLAQLGTDCISRKAAIDVLNSFDVLDGHTDKEEIKERIERLPSAQPEIIRCRECKFASGDSRICMKFDHSPIGELDFC